MISCKLEKKSKARFQLIVKAIELILKVQPKVFTIQLIIKIRIYISIQFTACFGVDMDETESLVLDDLL